MYFSGISKTRADYRSRYEAALEMISNEGDYEEAVRILTELGNYQEMIGYIFRKQNLICIMGTMVKRRKNSLNWHQEEILR